jgi:DNA repair exonuclease SbcCD ATPase subunit
MLIHEVSLRNIRSYEDFTINFAEGITLLSGDIGSGKSTILQSIEFSLFGIQRGGLEGESLLRHGSDEGIVSVLYTINNREVRVTRTLKRTSLGVRQTDGLLSIDGAVESLTAQELKARILVLLGYPEQLLTKSKGLIFRHTVYTPQEEMKHILFMGTEERLNTLRILFGIEKYRTIKENTQLLLRELRSQERTLLVSATQVPALEREQELAAQDVEKSKALVSAAEASAKEATAAVYTVRQAANAARAAWEQALALETQRTTLTQRIKELERSIRNTEEDIGRIDQYLVLPLEPVTDMTHLIDENRTALDAMQEQLLSATRELAELRGKHKLLAEQEHRITAMDACPMCKQAVTPEHKHHVHVAAEASRSEYDSRIAHLAQHEAQLRLSQQKLQHEAQRMNEQQKRFASYQKEVLVRREQEHNRARLVTRREGLTQELTQTQTTLSHLAPVDAAVQTAYTAAQTKLAAAEQRMHEQLAQLGSAREEHSRRASQLQLTADRLSQAKQSQQQIVRIQTLRQWLDDHFLELMTVVERHVLASIHAEFRELFQQWFSRLIEDETISVSLGEQFEPLVTQNGYDASLEQLSGGEKTAVALSYRLSLYRVVSDFIATVNTKDLLILDEPTDGFSTEQLDRVRDVLRELGCSQIILVSHETQMESGADQVIRVTKALHRSSAA